MNRQNNAADPSTIGGAEIVNHNATHITMNASKCKEKMEIAELVGSLRFIVDNLDEAAREATVAADAIEAKNVVAGRYHVARFAAHARAACGAFRDILGASVGEAA
jgi:hypothetical protein